MERAVDVGDAGHVVLEGDGVHGQFVRHGERGLEVAGLAVGRGRGVLPRAVHALDLLVDLGDVGFDLGGAEGLSVAHPGRASDGGGHEDRDALSVDDEIIALRQGQVQTAGGGGLVGLDRGDLAGRGGGLQGAGDLAQRVRIGLQTEELFGGVTALGCVVGHAVLVQRGLDPRVGRGVRGGGAHALHVRAVLDDVVVGGELVHGEAVAREGAAIACVQRERAVRGERGSRNA